MKQSRVDKVYEKIKHKYPNIKGESQIETLVREYIFQKKILLAILIYILATISIIALENIDKFLGSSESSVYNFAELALKFIGGFGTIISVMMFARALHDPLTPNEEKELQEKDTYEKTGRQ